MFESASACGSLDPKYQRQIETSYRPWDRTEALYAGRSISRNALAAFFRAAPATMQVNAKTIQAFMAQNLAAA
ncbi:MAG TPA: hypothetical protein VNO32_40230 [Candidatus Acidoferrum sp.]|jgi:hypothetical protein|nr:hypothetical protein [Candidatus Acidoferrum sp.]